MSDHTTRTLGSLISDADQIVRRHAHGILKRLTELATRQEADAAQCPEHPPGACYLSCPFRPAVNLDRWPEPTPEQ